MHFASIMVKGVTPLRNDPWSGQVKIVGERHKAKGMEHRALDAGQDHTF